MKRRKASESLVVDGVEIPPELAAGWLHPAFDAATAAERQHRYDIAVAGFAEHHGLIRTSGQLDWLTLERLGIHRVTALERAREAHQSRR